MIFQGQSAVLFKHSTFSGQNEMIHEGLVFIVNNNLILLSCVHPGTTLPAISLSEFADTFQILPAIPAISAPDS
jgi:hypothetical protein